ncbi:MAG: hypothetical protein PVJ21_03290 [Anaerolineales bacterium]|jgi:hypothetical protein
MNKIEAQKILHEELLAFRDKSYEELQYLMGSPHVVERNGASGTSYVIEIEVFWDNHQKTGGNLRVIGSIDDGKILSSLTPISSDFIMNSDGNFIGE